MLSMLFETGHPWITFKDPSNIRSPQDHVGVVHSSNLCTEILLNTSAEETAVCNLGSINLAHIARQGPRHEKICAQTIRTAMRMLDNVIDINFYPTAEAKNANCTTAPSGLASWASRMRSISKISATQAMKPSSLPIKHGNDLLLRDSWHRQNLPKSAAPITAYKGSKWDRGLLPIDTLDLLEKERGGFVEVDRTVTHGLDAGRDRIKKYGMRNSNTMAIAPTATISNITGCDAIDRADV